MTQAELDALASTVDAQAKAAIKKELDAYEPKMRQFAQEIVDQKGGITVAQFDAYKAAAEQAVEAVKSIAEKQGTTLAEMVVKMGNNGIVTKSISQVFEDDSEELRKIYNAGQGIKTYMITIEKGQAVMRAVDLSQQKAAGTQATISGVGIGGVAAITQALDAATLLRMGSGAQLYGQFRNTPWIFDLCNTINASFNPGMPFVIWFDEQPKVGGSTAVLEGGTKPLSQYTYILHSDTYKKEATLVSFTDEFRMDFAYLESDLLGKARIDVINRVNSAILPRIIAAAQIYNTEMSFRGGSPGDVVPNVNDFDAIAAMAAQVDNATYGGFLANAAVMSTFKKYRMGISKDTIGAYLNPPAVLNNISFVGNPAMDANAVMVGDFKQYNIILRGGLIVRVGFNGTDFAENKYSVVLEQFYFDYISAARKVAIVSGPDFATVKTDISTNVGSL